MFPLFAAGVIDTGGKFGAGVVDTGGKFAAGIVDTGGKFATSVNDTGGKWKKPSSRKILIILFGHLWIVELT